MVRLAIGVVLACAATGSAQSFLIDFDNLARGQLLGDQYLASRGVKFAPDAFSGPNNNNTAEPWATNTRLTIANASDYLNIGTLGSPSLVSGHWVRTTDDWNSENGDASVLVSIDRTILSATVDFAGITFFEEGARDTHLIALGPNDEILDIARAVGGFSVSQQRLQVYHPDGFKRLAIVPGNYNDYVAFDNLRATQPHEWTGATGGAWADAGNWLGGAPTTGSAASVVTSGTTPIVINYPATTDPIGAITFSGSADLTIAGSGIIALQTSELPESLLAVRSIDVDLEPAPAFASPGRLAIAGGSTLTLGLAGGKASARIDMPVAKSGGGVVVGSFDFGTLRLQEGTWRLGPGVSYSADLEIMEEATIDLALSMLGLTGLQADAEIEAWIASNRLGSSASTTEPRLTIGVAEASVVPPTFAGEPVRASATYALATLRGDANLDRSVGFADLLALAQNYQTVGSALWSKGNFDRDGEIGFGDLLLLAQNYGLSVGPDGSISPSDQPAGEFIYDWTLARSLVPEPTSLIVALAAGFALRRRKSVT